MADLSAIAKKLDALCLSFDGAKESDSYNPRSHRLWSVGRGSIKHFAWIRNPIYMALNLFAIGTALWCPTAIVGFGALLMLIGSDLRARAEEKLLEQSFGDAYRQYRAHTRRFLPGLY